MNISKIITLICVILVSLTSFVLSYFQFKEKGVLLNNAYFYASKKQRDKMNKKLYYRQSSIIFLFIGIIFSLNALEIILKSSVMFWLSLLFAVAVIIYAILSSIKIKKK